MGVRAYDPAALGRFLSVDPVLAPDNPKQNNGYGYSGNNPVTYSDPDGKCYNSRTDSFTHQANCAGGRGVNARAAGSTPYYNGAGSTDPRAPSSKAEAGGAGPVFGNPRRASDLSHEKLLEWMASNQSRTIQSVALTVCGI